MKRRLAAKDYDSWKPVELARLAVRFARADSLSRERYWIKRCDIPAVSPDTSAEKREELEEALSAFFLATQARGKHCQVEHYRRASGADYFFAYLDDYADTYVTLDNDGAFDRRAERRAFELVMVYDRDNGTLEMYARGGKKVYVPLQEIFCRLSIELSTAELTVCASATTGRVHSSVRRLGARTTAISTY